jgi:DNA-directed RNA polymerase subunit F
MTVEEEKPLTISEVINLIGDSQKEEDVKEFLKGFNNMPSEKAKELKQKLEELKILKLKEMDVVKIIDFLPEDSIELNKIVSESNLDAEEIAKILDAIRD